MSKKSDSYGYEDEWGSRRRTKKDKPGKKHNNQYHANYTNANKKQAQDTYYNRKGR